VVHPAAVRKAAHHRPGSLRTIAGRNVSKIVQGSPRSYGLQSESGSGLLLYKPPYVRCAHQSLVDALGYVGAGLPTEYWSISFSRSHLWTASRACDSISVPTHCFLVTATPNRNSTFSRCSLRAAFVGWRQQVWKLPRGVLKGFRQETMSSSPTNIRQKEFQSSRQPNR